MDEKHKRGRWARRGKETHLEHTAYSLSILKYIRSAMRAANKAIIMVRSGPGGLFTGIVLRRKKIVQREVLDDL